MSLKNAAVMVVMLAGCAVGAEERRATETTEAQLPGSPELYTETEFEQASAEITRYEDAQPQAKDERDKRAATDAHGQSR